MLLTEFDEKKFAKSIWKEGHESGYTEGRESILEFWMRSTGEMIP